MRWVLGVDAEFLLDARIRLSPLAAVLSNAFGSAEGGGAVRDGDARLFSIRLAMAAEMLARAATQRTDCPC